MNSETYRKQNRTRAMNMLSTNRTSWLSLKGAKGRLSFLVSMLLCLGGCLTLLWVFNSFLPMNFVTYSILAVIFTLAGLIMLALTAQRLRDCGVSGWFTLCWLPLLLLGAEYHIVFTLVFSLVLVLLPPKIMTKSPDQEKPC